MLKIENLRKSYGRIEAVRGVSFEVGDGIVHSIIGPNGAGKTTILKSIMGFLRYDGEISFRGSPVTERIVIERFSFLPEEKNLYPEMKVKDIIEMSRKLVPNLNPRILEDFIAGFGIPIDRKFLELSHGVKTLLYVSLVFSKEADLYILDEPTWGLDPTMRRKVFDAMNELVADGKSIIYTSHVLPEVEKMADTLMVLKNGVKVFEESLEVIREEYRVAFSRFEPVGYEYVKKVEAGYLVLAREEEISGEFEAVSPATVEDVFEIMVEGE